MGAAPLFALRALFFVIFPLAWIAFSVWTWRRLRPRGEGTLLQRIQRDTGMSFGLGIWLTMTVVEYIHALDGAFPASLVGSRALFQLGWHLFFSFPFCLWVGRVFGTTMRAALGAPHGVR